MMFKSKVLPTVLTLSPFVFSFAFAMDIYIPAVPQMKDYFHTSQSEIQLTLSIFMWVAGFGQLFWGAAADQFGRRPLILASAFLFTLGSFLCAVANSINFLLLARMIESLGGCGMLVIAFAIVRDQFSGNQSAKIYSFLNCGVAVSPLFAPIIGSYLSKWFNWRAGFLFLTIMGMLIFILAWFKIKETLAAENKIPIDKKIFLRYGQILLNKNFIANSICATAGLTVFFVFFSSSPYIVINLLKIPLQDFGYCFFMIGLAFFAGSLLSGKIVEYWGSHKTIVFGSSIMLLAGLLMYLWYLLAGMSLAQFIIPCMIAGIGGAFMMGAGLAGAMEPFYNLAGSAAALVGSLEFLGSGLIGALVMHFPVTSTIALSITMMALSILALAAKFKI